MRIKQAVQPAGTEFLTRDGGEQFCTDASATKLRREKANRAMITKHRSLFDPASRSKLTTMSTAGEVVIAEAGLLAFTHFLPCSLPRLWHLDSTMDRRRRGLRRKNPGGTPSSRRFNKMGGELQAFL